MAWEFPKLREILVAQKFLRLKLFPPISRETGISREFPVRGFPLNITDLQHASVADEDEWAEHFRN